MLCTLHSVCLFGAFEGRSLDRILMSSATADALASKASQKELSGDLDGAFSLYIQASQSYLHLSRTATASPHRDRCGTSAARCLERAQRIKAAKSDVAPVRRDRFSKGVSIS